jgi:hypothetical protein
VIISLGILNLQTNEITAKCFSLSTYFQEKKKKKKNRTERKKEKKMTTQQCLNEE